MKKLLSESLRADLTKTNTRLAELQPQFDAAQDKFTADQKAFTNGDISFEQITESKRELEVLGGIVKPLLATAGELINQISAAQADEKRKAVVAGLKDQIATIRITRDRCTATREDLGKAAARAADDESMLNRAKADLADAVRQVIPLDLLTSPGKNQRTEFEAFMLELESAGVSRDEYELAGSRGNTFPETEYSRAAQLAVNAIFQDRFAVADSARLNRQDRAQSAASWERQRAEKAA